jgi:hypothetical protein
MGQSRGGMFHLAEYLNPESVRPEWLQSGYSGNVCSGIRNSGRYCGQR